MQDICLRYNLPCNIRYIIQTFLKCKHLFNKVIDDIDLGTHTIRYTDVYANITHDVYIPNIDRYIEIKLSNPYNMIHRPLSNSKPFYYCRNCKKTISVICGNPPYFCKKFECHLKPLYY